MYPKHDDRPSTGMALPAITSNQPSRRVRCVQELDVAAVQADDQRQVRPGQRGPVGGAAGDEPRPLLAELVLQALRGGPHLPPHRGGVQRPAQREDLVEQVGGQPVGHQPGETGLQVGQLRGDPLPQDSGQRAERADAGPRRAGTGPPAGAVQTQHAEHRAHHDAPAVLVTRQPLAVVAPETEAGATATSSSPVRRGLPGKISAGTATVSPRSPPRPAWLGSQTPRRSQRLQGA